MPGKGRRVASQQARLSRRRHHGRGPSGIPAVAPAAQAEDGDRPVSQPTVPLPPAAAPGPRPRAEFRPAVLNYIGPELKRIAVVAGVAIVILAVLSVALG